VIRLILLLDKPFSDVIERFLFHGLKGVSIVFVVRICRECAFEAKHLQLSLQFPLLHDHYSRSLHTVFIHQVITTTIFISAKNNELCDSIDKREKERKKEKKKKVSKRDQK
jgi:hypothetical protein